MIIIVMMVVFNDDTITSINSDDNRDDYDNDDNNNDNNINNNNNNDNINNNNNNNNDNNNKNKNNNNDNNNDDNEGIGLHSENHKSQTGKSKVWHFSQSLFLPRLLPFSSLQGTFHEDDENNFNEEHSLLPSVWRSSHAVIL